MLRGRLKFTDEEKAAIAVVSQMYIDTMDRKIREKGADGNDLKVKNVLSSIVVKVNKHKKESV